MILRRIHCYHSSAGLIYSPPLPITATWCELEMTDGQSKLTYIDIIVIFCFSICGPHGLLDIDIFLLNKKKQKTHTLSQLSLGESRIRHVEHKFCTGLNKLIFCCVVCGRTVFSYCCSSCLWKDSLILCCWADTIEFEWHFNFISKMTKENCLHEVATAMSFSCVW